MVHEEKNHHMIETQFAPCTYRVMQKAKQSIFIAQTNVF